jgi:transcriptional regulator with XRE-family HTH domain
MGTVRHNLRRLRDFLGLEQRQMAILARRSLDTIEALEQNRLRLSPKLAVELSKRFGVDAGWLLSDDLNLPMTNRSGGAYTAEDFRVAQNEDLKPLQFYQVTPELKVGAASDLFFRALKCARKQNSVPQFVHELEGFARKMVHQFPELKQEVYREMQARDRAHRKDFLFPSGVAPLKRCRRRFAEAIAELSAREKTIKK